MRLTKYVVIFIVLLLIIGMGIILYPKNRIVEKNYYEKASLYSGYYFSKIKETRGEPQKERWETREDGWKQKSLVYEGYRYMTSYLEFPDETRDYTAGLIEITDPMYQIGSQKLGIGSKRKQIEKAYKHSKPITDLSDESKLGYIDGGVWVVFSFAPDDTVSQIQIYEGP